MWLWQHKNIHKRHLLWAKLFGICLFSHLIFLFWVFCVYRDNIYTISISLNKKLDYSAPILFMPRGAPTQTTAAVAKPIVIKPTPAKTVVPKKAPTVMAVIKPTITAAPIKKLEQPNPAPVKKIEPPTPAPSFAKALADKPIVKKEEVKPPPVETKKEIIKKEAAKLPFDTPPLAALPPSLHPSLKASEDTARLRSAGRANGGGKEVAPLIPENAYVSDNYREVEALRRHAQLQNEIINCWKPPFGVSPTCACDISFSVNKTGGLHDITIIKGSGVMMYDISARQALYSMTMPKWTYGKQLIINFKQ